MQTHNPNDLRLQNLPGLLSTPCCLEPRGRGRDQATPTAHPSLLTLKSSSYRKVSGSGSAPSPLPPMDTSRISSQKPKIESGHQDPKPPVSSPQDLGAVS